MRIHSPRFVYPKMLITSSWTVYIGSISRNHPKQEGSCFLVHPFSRSSTRPWEISKSIVPNRVFSTFLLVLEKGTPKKWFTSCLNVRAGEQNILNKKKKLRLMERFLLNYYVYLGSETLIKPFFTISMKIDSIILILFFFSIFFPSWNRLFKKFTIQCIYCL